MELNAVLKRIRALINLAEAPIAQGATDSERAATEQEQARARERADALMQEYLIEEAQLQSAVPANEQAKPVSINVDLGQGDSLFLRDIAALVEIISNYCRCRAVWMIGSGCLRSDRQEQSRVYGYPSDLRYFELMFTTIHLHMIGAIFPRPDDSKSLEDNCWELHNAGLNWLDIARAYGWVKLDNAKYGQWKNVRTNEYGTTPKVGSHYKRAYQRAARARGEKPRIIHAGASLNFRKNAAQGYLNRIYTRLNAAAGKRQSGAELVLAGKQEGIEAMLAEKHPEMKEQKARKMAFNRDAYERGTTHANAAPLNPNAMAGQKKEVSAP